MNDQFYLTLPSNSTSEGNSASNFTTSLPIQVNLEDKWEVGLAEIIYGNKTIKLIKQSDSLARSSK